MKKSVAYILFIIVVVGELAGEVAGIRLFYYIFKPLIIPLIAGIFLLSSKNRFNPPASLYLWALLFSWLGDVTLMFAQTGELFFQAGLGCFLVSQVFFILFFLKIVKQSVNRPFLKRQPFWLIAYLAYALFFYLLLFNHLDMVLRVAVLFYMVALLGMSAMALNLLGIIRQAGFICVFIGSLFFIASDTMLAVNKFLVVLPLEGVLIMGTYIAAQFLIMSGLANFYTRQKTVAGSV